MDGVFVGSGIFKSGDPAKRARAIVQVRACAHALFLPSCLAGIRCLQPPHPPPPQPTLSASLPFCVLPQAVTHYNDPAILAEVSCDLGEPMVGIDVREKGFKSYAQRSE